MKKINFNIQSPIKFIIIFIILFVTTGLSYSASRLVVGPPLGSTNNSVPLWDGTGGFRIKNSSMIYSNDVLYLISLISPSIETSELTSQIMNIGEMVLTNKINSTNIVNQWVEVIPDTTNSTINLQSSHNFYYTITTSNYITFSNIESGVQGIIKIFTDGNPHQINWNSEYDNWSTNVLPFTIENKAWIQYTVDFGTDNTNINLNIIQK